MGARDLHTRQPLVGEQSVGAHDGQAATDQPGLVECPQDPGRDKRKPAELQGPIDRRHDIEAFREPGEPVLHGGTARVEALVGSLGSGFRGPKDSQRSRRFR